MLHQEAAKGHVDAITTLIDDGVDVDDRDELGGTALHIAAWQGHIEVCKVLLDRGATANARDNSGWTALHCASQEGKIDVAKLLLEKGCALNATTNRGKTPLMIAQEKKRPNLVNLFTACAAGYDSNGYCFFHPEIKVHNINNATFFGKIDKPCYICQDIKRGKSRVVLSHTAATSKSSGLLQGMVDNFMPLMRQQTIKVTASAMNDGCVTDPQMVATCDWRGKLVDRKNPAFSFASVVVENARKLCLRTAMETDMRDSDWMKKAKALEFLCGTQDQTCILGSLQLLTDECKRILAAQPVCVSVSKPAKIFGDVHGQLRDLLLLFREFGFPSNRGGDVDCVSYVFNGDWIDRGRHQVEVVTLLFSLKVLFPSRIFLVRGNHEFVDVDPTKYGFRSECRRRFGDANGLAIFKIFHLTFRWLPFSAIIDKVVLVIHGGIGDGRWGLADLRAIQRPVMGCSVETTLTKTERAVRDAVWSDPMEGDEAMNRGVHGSPRGEAIHRFSSDVTLNFCRLNDIQLIIRSHQYVPEGYRIMHHGRLITVFSARNYFDDEELNDGALIFLADDEDGNLQCRAKKLENRLHPTADAPVPGNIDGESDLQSPIPSPKPPDSASSAFHKPKVVEAETAVSLLLESTVEDNSITRTQLPEDAEIISKNMRPFQNSEPDEVSSVVTPSKPSLADNENAGDDNGSTDALDGCASESERSSYETADGGSKSARVRRTSTDLRSAITDEFSSAANLARAFEGNHDGDESDAEECDSMADRAATAEVDILDVDPKARGVHFVDDANADSDDDGPSASSVEPTYLQAKGLRRGRSIESDDNND